MEKNLIRGLLHRAVNVHPRFRLLLLRLFFPDRDFEVELFGSRLWINARQEVGYLMAQKMAGLSIPLGGDAGILATLALLLEPGDTFVDVGANVGLYSAVMARAAGVYPRMKFYAFEPHPETAKRLRKSLASLPVEIRECALSDREGELEFYEGAGSWTFGVRVPQNPFQIRGSAVRVRAQRLDDLPIEGDSIVLKVDVENHEAEVLRGAQGLLGSGRVKALYLDGYADLAIPDVLRGSGFSLFDGRNLTACAPEHRLLAISQNWLARCARSDKSISVFQHHA